MTGKKICTNIENLGVMHKTLRRKAIDLKRKGKPQEGWSADSKQTLSKNTTKNTPSSAAQKEKSF